MHGTDMYLDRTELSMRADTPKCSTSSCKMRGLTGRDRSEEGDEDARADFENLVSVNDTILDRAFEIGNAPAESENRQAKTARGKWCIEMRLAHAHKSSKADCWSLQTIRSQKPLI